MFPSLLFSLLFFCTSSVFTTSFTKFWPRKPGVHCLCTVNYNFKGSPAGGLDVILKNNFPNKEGTEGIRDMWLGKEAKGDERMGREAGRISRVQGPCHL